MYSGVAFILVFLQALVAGITYATGATELFYDVVVYGSPFYLAMNMLTQFSVFFDVSPIYLFMFCFHILKYALIFRSQLTEDRNLWRTLAILGEIGYLSLAGYYLN